jgi:hypothetical protein
MTAERPGIGVTLPRLAGSFHQGEMSWERDGLG